MRSAQALILQAINALRGRETRDYIVRPPLWHFQVMPTHAYAYNSYKKGKLRVYLIYKLKVLKVSGAHAPLGPTVDTPLLLITAPSVLRGTRTPPQASPHKNCKFEHICYICVRDPSIRNKNHKAV